MPFPAEAFGGLRDGSITVAFRRWKRPTVKAGGTLTTPAGVLAIEAVDVVDTTSIDDDAARSAGAPSADAILAALASGSDRTLYRITFHRQGDDPRIALRGEDDLDAPTRADLGTRLARLDARSPTAPWTTAVLSAIAENPGTVSAELADRLGDDRPRCKQRVRRLNALGLTESLETGYRLSPRGVA